LQQEVDKLCEIIDLNEGNYNQVIIDNKIMYDQNVEYQNKEK
jgi:hypothetical protein